MKAGSRPAPSPTASSSAVESPASGQAARELIRGLYAITPDEADTGALVRAVEQTLGAGTRLLQYRNKKAGPLVRREQLRVLQPICAAFGCTLVVNDDWREAIDLGIGAVHIGGDDGNAAEVRAAIGPEVILGVSCYASLARAAESAPHADYLAFGSMFPSSTKPTAVSAAMGMLREARGLGKPLVAIGGINRDNARLALDAGADAIAVISGVFGEASVAEATAALLKIIGSVRK